jgi:hypothetical protein
MFAVRNVPPEPDVVHSNVPPLIVIVAPALAVMAPEDMYESLVPVPMVMFCVVKAAPVRLTWPSSTVTAGEFMADPRFMVQALVASVPAEKMAESVPEVKVVEAEVPAESVAQCIVAQVPPPVPCPEPATAPLMSHHLLAARRLPEERTMMVASALRTGTFFISEVGGNQGSYRDISELLIESTARPMGAGE